MMLTGMVINNGHLPILGVIKRFRQHINLPSQVSAARSLRHLCSSTSSMQAFTSQKSDYVAREVSGERIDLGVGQPSPSSLPLAALAEAAAHRLGSKDAELLLQYGPRQGYRSFRTALASFLSQRYGVAVDADHLMVTAGVSHGIDLAVRALSRPGDVVALESPTYFLVPPILAGAHVVTHTLPMDEQGLDVGALEDRLSSDPGFRPRLLYLIPVHHNPRGTTLPACRRHQLLRLAAQYDFYVIADEVYQLLTFPTEDDQDNGVLARSGKAGEALGGLSSGAAAGGDVGDAGGDGGHAGGACGPNEREPVPLPLRCYEDCDPVESRVVSLGSFSKMLAPALRLGWAECSNPSVLSALRENGVINSGGCIAQLSTGIAHSAIELGLQATHLDGVVRPGLAARCRTLVSALHRHLPAGMVRGLLRPRGGYFVWLELSEQVDTRVLLGVAETRHGLRFTPGPACGGGPAYCMRLCFAFYNEQELEEGARRLGAAVREHMGGRHTT